MPRQNDIKLTVEKDGTLTVKGLHINKEGAISSTGKTKVHVSASIKTDDGMTLSIVGHKKLSNQPSIV